MQWAPLDYLKYEEERTRPSRDLLAQIRAVDPKLIVDLGCGPGNSTELLTKRFPDASVVGIDSSSEMLGVARERVPSARFFRMEITEWSPEENVDVIFANAVFQWVPDHLTVIERLLKALRPESVLAIQVPDNLDEPSHALMRKLASSESRKTLFPKPILREKILAPEEYYTRLKPLCKKANLWRTDYLHPLRGPEAIVEMVKSTGLNPYLRQLSEGDREYFLEDYQAEIAKAYPVLFDGTVLFKFPRFFLVAER